MGALAGGVGGVGLISTLRSYLWIPISQDAERRISVEFFDHLLYLDLTFHLKRKTGAQENLNCLTGSVCCTHARGTYAT